MPIKPTYPGVYIQEQRSGVQTISGVDTSIAAFFGTAPKGPIGKPTRVFTYSNFEEIFGIQTNRGELPLQVKMFFLNGGGTAWITRLAQGAAPATATLANESGTDVLTLTALDEGVLGNTIQVEVDYKTQSPERTFNMTIYRRTLDSKGNQVITDSEVLSNLSMDPASPFFIESQVANESALISAEVMDAINTEHTNNPAPSNLSGSISGWIYDSSDTAGSIHAAVVGAMPASDGDGAFGRISISVNHQPAVSVTLRPDVDFPGFQNAAQTAINSAISSAEQIGSVTINAVDQGGFGFLVFSSDAGPVTIRSAGSDDLAAALRLGVQNGGIETDGFTRLRPVQTGVSARLHGAEIFEVAINLFGENTSIIEVWQFATNGITYERTVPGPLAGATGTLIEHSAVTLPGAGVVGSFAAFKANLQILANDLKENMNRAWDASVNGMHLTLTPRLKRPNSGVGAAFTVSAGGAGTALNTIFPQTPGPGHSANASAYPLGAGSIGDYITASASGDDGDIPQPGDYDDAYEQLARDADIFNILVLSRCRSDSAVQTDSQRSLLWGPASAFCRDNRAFLIMDPPSDSYEWSNVNQVTGANGIETLRIGVVGDHAAVYWPRLQVADDTGKPHTIDPSGAMAGLFARTDGARGVWKAPAGISTTLTGVRGLEHNVTDPENGVTNLAAVNTSRQFSQGIVSWGARTLAGFENSGEDDWRHIPIRRTALFIEESLYRGLKFAVFEPNAEPLWGQIRLAAGAFMNNLFRQGAFKGMKSSDAYFVECNANTTTQNDINLGIVNVRVGFSPLKPAEFVVVTIRQMAGQIDV